MRKLKHAEIPRPTPTELAELPRFPVVAVLDNVRSRYNVGSILRTADGVRLDAVYLTGITSTPEHREVHKTALGAQETVPWQYHPDPVACVQALKDTGFTIAALEITDTPREIKTLTLPDFPLALIVGHEVFGVRDELMALADLALELPQYGAKQSFNVAVAFGIAAFNVIHHYIELKK